jgi:hypothetical protein
MVRSLRFYSSAPVVLLIPFYKRTNESQALLTLIGEATVLKDRLTVDFIAQGNSSVSLK